MASMSKRSLDRPDRSGIDAPANPRAPSVSFGDGAGRALGAMSARGAAGTRGEVTRFDTPARVGDAGTRGLEDDALARDGWVSVSTTISRSRSANGAYAPGWAGEYAVSGTGPVRGAPSGTLRGVAQRRQSSSST